MSSLTHTHSSPELSETGTVYQLLLSLPLTLKNLNLPPYSAFLTSDYHVCDDPKPADCPLEYISESYCLGNTIFKKILKFTLARTERHPLNLGGKLIGFAENLSLPEDLSTTLDGNSSQV